MTQDSKYEPGTVAVATVCGVPNVRIAYVDPDDPGMAWIVLTGKKAGGYEETRHITDVRPLVVLDPDDTDTLDRLVTLFHESWSGCEGSRGIGLGGALRMLTKPPRIPEPGLWGVVQDRDHSLWVCTEPGRWRRLRDNVDWPWVDLVDPVLVRDGIEA